MTEKFNPFEIFELAEQVERNGARFYRRAAEIVDDEHTRELLLTFARMEEDHERTFAQLKTELTPAGESDSMVAPHGEASEYLKAFADGVLFSPDTDPAEHIGTDATLTSILRTAITAEKDTIALYVGLREMVPGEEQKARIDAIVREEMGHATQLSNELVAYLRTAR